MRIVILSDTHGNYPLALRAVEAEACDEVVHLGDELEDAVMVERITGRPLVKVAGNCDYTALFPREICVDFAATRIFIAHGDTYQVKSGLGKLHRKAQVEKASIVLYGHTHRAAIETIDGVLYINPGCMNSRTIPPTYGVLILEGDTARAEIVTVDS